MTGVKEDRVDLGNESIKARTVIWAAGVQPSSLGKDLDVPLDPIGRVIIEKDLSLKNHPEVFVLGDQLFFRPMMVKAFQDWLQWLCSRVRLPRAIFCEILKISHDVNFITWTKE